MVPLVQISLLHAISTQIGVVHGWADSVVRVALAQLWLSMVANLRIRPHHLVVGLKLLERVASKLLIRHIKRSVVVMLL